ncbi:MAG: NAD-dependent epimerase/dehydratase family protein [Phycisphaerales bacterium]|nr:NAD-dependent epimerase/dehydratase family protein [Phycisphaerales bacterium]
MKVLVTGGCGFIGSHTCDYFRREGWDVVAYDNMTKFELKRTGYREDAVRDYNWNLLGELGVERVREDIRDLEQLLDRSSGCDFLVHTAAQPAVTISMEDPLLDLSTNIQGTVNVLEAARRHNIPVVTCATIHVYGNWLNQELKETETRYVREPAAVDENAATMRGNLTPLHASKAAAEHYVKAYIDTYKVRAASFRLTGLYGPQQFGGEDHGWVANFSIRNVLGWPLTIYGTGKQVRDVLYATDVPTAFHAFFKNCEPGIYNIGGGPEHAISLIECIRLIDQTTGKPSEIQYAPDRHGDLRYFICDIHQAKTKLKWEPQVRPAQGVPRLIGWIKENRSLFST